MSYNQNVQGFLSKSQDILKENFPFFESLLRSFSAKNSIPSWDIIFFLTSLKIKDDEIKFSQWTEFWRKNSFERKYKNFKYIPYLTYYPFYNENEAEKLFIRILYIINEAKEFLTEQQLWKYYFSLLYPQREKIKPKFSKVEYKVFLKMIEKQSTDLTILHRELNMAKSNLYNYIKRIKEKGVLFEGPIVDIEKLKLELYSLKIETSHGNKGIEQFYSDNPFTRTRYICTMGTRIELQSYLIPQLKELQEELIQIKEKIEKDFTNTRVELFKHDRINRLYSYNYYPFDYKQGNWQFDEIELKYELLLKSINKGTEVKIFQDFQPKEDFKLKLDKEELEILKFLYQFNYKSLNQIVEETKIKPNKVKETIKMFEKKELLKNCVKPLAIFGLTNINLYLNETKEKQRELHKELSFFPELYTEPIINQITKEEKLQVIIRIPENIALSVVDELNKKYQNKIDTIFIVNQMHSTRKELPLKYFDTLFKEWKIN